MPTILTFKHLRESKGFKTQAELANTLKCSRSTISMWEIGAGTPNKKNINKLLHLLNIDYETLLKCAEFQKNKNKEE